MRICLGIEYKGTNYHGWQKQDGGLLTVQSCIEKALTKVANHDVNVVCAGRTDVGVHARGQVIHFNSDAKRRLESWVLGANSNLPHDITVKWAKSVDDNFHARFSARARQYRYLIYNHKTRSAIYDNLVTWHHDHLNHKLMDKAAHYLIGDHDFSSFRGSSCQSKSARRNVQLLTVRRMDNLVIIDIKANAFLLHMVRNIAGLLIAVGEGKKEPIWAKKVLQKCDRRVCGITAQASGLYLQRVFY